MSPVLQNRTFQVHSIIQLNTEVNIKTKGNNHSNSFYQIPHHALLVPNTQQTSLVFVFLRSFSHVQKCVVIVVLQGDAFSQSI